MPLLCYSDVILCYSGVIRLLVGVILCVIRVLLLCYSDVILCYSVSKLVTGPWSPFDYCHILEVFAVPVVTQPVLSAFVMAAALGLLRVRRAGGLRSDEPLEKGASSPM